MNRPAPASASGTGGHPAATPLVDVRGLHRSFDVSAPWITRVVTRQPRKLLRAVDDVSFSIAAGQTLSLVGESGCGKSTVARCVSGLMAPSGGGVTYRGVDMQQIARGAHPHRAEIQMIFQDPYGSLNPRWRVGRLIAEPLRAMKLVATQAEARDAVAQLLQNVGLSPADAHKFPHEFSGGQRQRIAIARALATRPAFIVCDEPTSALDVSVQAQILNLMRDLQEEFGLTYLFISHNLAVVDHVADAVGVMYLGRIVEMAPRQTLFAQPLHPYTRLLIKAMPTLQAIGAASEVLQGEVPNPIDPPRGCAFNPRCPFANDRCRQERPQLRELRGHQVACHRVEEIA